MTTTTAPATYKGKTAAEWRQAAIESRRESTASWERSDTDGFLSQWACDSVAREYDLCAQLIEQGGTTTFPAVFLADGRIASVDQREGQYGAYWLLNDEATAVYGKRFFTESKAAKAATRRANNLRKGFTMGIIRVAGEVKMVGNSIMSVRPIITVDEQALRRGEYTIVSTDDPGTDN